ncbi:MAG: DUF2079 domain-containing protein, partial [Candidatus Goldbacteria bacterium]|nr:DUF2079 domain-containing protein [Candidatus Goldiibacteriota bacterium]
MAKDKIIKGKTANLYSLSSSLFIIYLSSLIFTYFIYGFISYQFRVFDFITENAPLQHPLLFVLLFVFIFVGLCVFLFFDSSRITILILHFFSALTFIFLFIISNSNGWVEYENTLYTVSGIFLLSAYCAWLLGKVIIKKINILFQKYSILIFIIFCIFYFVYFSNLATERHNRFYSQLYDMGWEHQVLYNLSTTGAPYSTVESKDGIINWADHTSFIYYLLVPFYKLFPSVEFMLIFQILAVILASFLIFLLADIVLKNKFYAAVISLAFLLHPSVQGFLLEDFHPTTLALPLFFLLILFAEKKNFIGLITCIFLLSAVREEFVFFSFFVGLYLLLTRKINFGNFLYIIVISYAMAVIALVIMNFSGKVISDYNRFYFLTNKFWGVVSVVFVNPLFIFRQIFTAERLDFLLLTGVSLLFLFFLHRPGWVLILPGFLFTIFSKHVPHFLVGYHYSVIFICAIFTGIIYFLNETNWNKDKIIVLISVLMFFVNYFYGNISSKSIQLVNVNPELAITKPDFIYKNWIGYYKNLRGEKDPEIKEYIKTIPPSLKVAADPFIAPHVSGRRYIYHIKNYDWADVVIDRKESSGTYPNFKLIKETKLWKVYKKM